MLLPDIARGPTWSAQHMHRCLVRQLLRWRAEGNRSALEAMKQSRIYPGTKDDANEQWVRGNRGAQGDWR